MKQILSSDWSGMNWSERLWKDRELVGKKVTEILSKGIPQGTSLQTMSRELKNATGTSFKNAFRLIRTETSHIDGAVTLEGYKQAKEELGLEYYEYDAFLDTRTSAICEELNGKRFRIDEAEVGVNYPPMHPNCRSTTQLVLDENYKKEEKETVKVGANENKNSEAKETNKNSAHKNSDDKPVLIEKGTQKKGSEIPKEEVKEEINANNIKEKLNKLEDKNTDIISYLNASNLEFEKLAKERAFLNAENTKYFRKYCLENDENALIKAKKMSKAREKIAEKMFSYNEKTVNELFNKLNDAKNNLNVVNARGLDELATDLKEKINKIINKNLLSDETISITHTFDSRSAFRPSVDKILIDERTRNMLDIKVALHESMHWLEHHNKDVLNKSVAFLEYRTKSENAVKLSDLTGSKGYKDVEIAKKDNFFSPYCGKIYKNRNDEYYGTEILSMGLEQIYEYPLEFYKKDPEYFNFVISVLRGLL